MVWRAWNFSEERMGFGSKVAASALLLGLNAQAGVNAQQQGAIQPAQLTGSWKSPTGSCNPAYFKGADPTKTVRGENALAATVVDKGMTVQGIVILQGAREGQMVNAMTDQAIFLIDLLADKKLQLIPIGAPVLAWQEITLEACP
jgi:hypothetical protein